MPLFWRYLLSQYLKTFSLCVVAFIAILLTMRLDEIAYFATLGADVGHIAWFAVQQIPYILPIAMPIAALISAILLVQQLSHAHEITAMRTCGFSLGDILAPILVAALLLSTLNFYIISEMSTTSHLGAGQLKTQLRSINPLLVLQNKHIMQVKGFYYDTLGPSRVGEYAQDIVFFSPNKHNNRLNLLVAKQLHATPEQFTGQQVSLLTSRQRHADEPETLIIENMQSSTTSIEDFSQMLEKKIWSINNDHLQMAQLLVRVDEARSQLQAAQSQGKTSEVKPAKHFLYCCLSEIVRRFSVAFAVFSFTLMGLAFGINISRNHSNRGIFIVIFLAALYLIAFFAAKSFEHALIATTLLYMLPHVIICSAALWTLRRTAHGIE